MNDQIFVSRRVNVIDCEDVRQSMNEGVNMFHLRHGAHLNGAESFFRDFKVFMEAATDRGNGGDGASVLVTLLRQPNVPGIYEWLKPENIKDMVARYVRSVDAKLLPHIHWELGGGLTYETMMAPAMVALRELVLTHNINPSNIHLGFSANAGGYDEPHTLLKFRNEIKRYPRLKKHIRDFVWPIRSGISGREWRWAMDKGNWKFDNAGNPWETGIRLSLSDVDSNRKSQTWGEVTQKIFTYSPLKETCVPLYVLEPTGPLLSDYYAAIDSAIKEASPDRVGLFNRGKYPEVEEEPDPMPGGELERIARRLTEMLENLTAARDTINAAIEKASASIDRLGEITEEKQNE